MSQIISLVEYDYRNKKLCENNSKTIETTFIDEDCVKIIKTLIGTANIYEDSDSDEFSKIDCVTDIDKSIKLYESKFYNLIKDENKNNNKDYYKSMQLFRTLTNICHIFWLKKDKFNNTKNAIIKLG